MIVSAVEPATTLASSPCSARSATASAIEWGRRKASSRVMVSLVMAPPRRCCVALPEAVIVAIGRCAGEALC